MVVLTALPHQDIISAFKGKVDFYLWKGIPVARKWPVWPRRQPTPTERANQQDFKLCNQLYPQLPPYIQLHYQNMARSTRLTSKDMFVRAYMRGIEF